MNEKLLTKQKSAQPIMTNTSRKVLLNLTEHLQTFSERKPIDNFEMETSLQMQL